MPGTAEALASPVLVNSPVVSGGIRPWSSTAAALDRVAAAFGCGMTLCLLPPLVVCAVNADVGGLSPAGIAAGGAAAAATVGALLALPALLPRAGAAVADLCRAVTCTVFVLTLFPNHTGEVTGMEEFLARSGSVAAMLKLLDVALLSLLLAWKRPRLFRTLHGGVLAVTAVLVLAISGGLRFVPPAAAGENTPAARARCARLGATGNVVIVVLDAFPGHRMAELLAADHDLRERLRGFTLHPRAIAPAFNTPAGISVLLTGGLETALAEASGAARNNRMLAASWLREATEKRGCESAYLSHLLPSAPQPFAVLNEQLYFDGARLAGGGDRLLLSLSMARILPPCLWRVVSRRLAPPPPAAGEEKTLPVAEAWRRATHVCAKSACASEMALNHLIDNLTVAPGPPRLLFFHSQLTHPPYMFNAAGEATPRQDAAGTLKHAARLLARLTEKMRRLGVFDTSLLLVVSDHGFGTPDESGANEQMAETTLPDPVFNPLVMVKPPGASAPFRRSAMTVWLGDVAATARDFLSLPPRTTTPGTRSLLAAEDPSRRLDVPLFRRSDQAAFHSSLAGWFRQDVSGDFDDYARAVAAPPRARLSSGATARLHAGTDPRRTQSVRRGWLPGAGTQYRALIEVDGVPAAKAVRPGACVAMAIRAGTAAGGEELPAEPAAIARRLAEAPPEEMILLSGTRLARRELLRLLPAAAAAAVPESEGPFNIVCAAGGGPFPTLRIATTNVTLCVAIP